MSLRIAANVVDFYILPITVILSSVPNYVNLVNQVKSAMSTRPTPQRIPILLPSLENCNLCYAEKQLRGIDYNFSDYHWGYRIPLAATTRPLPRNLQRLLRKSFSGDVSGGMGEALFAYYLLEILGVPPQRFAHLRPEKRRRRLTADFFVSNDGNWLDRVLGVHADEVCVEVKSSTGPMPEERIEAGLAQLHMTSGLGDYGILFLVCRSNPQQGYECYFVKVRKV